ncbi:MAG: alpha/beta hydrolase [Bacteroidota bacterium]
MRLLLFGLLIAFAPAALAQPDNLAGSWDGAISIGAVTLDITVTFGDATPPAATIDIPQQGAMGLPLQNVTIDLPAVRFELQAGPGLAVFEGTRDGDIIAGAFTQSPASGTFSVTWQDPASAPPEASAEPEASFETEPLPPGVLAETVTVDTPTGTLHGTLTWPAEAAQPVPGVVLVSGSGPTDRDGNSIMLPGKNNSLRLLAEALTAEGFAVVRFDKRGVAASAESSIAEVDLRVETFAEDVATWGRWLRADARTTDALALIGHSEGTLVGVLAAEDLDADGFVALAGLGRPIQVVLRRQLAAQLPDNVMAEADSLFATLERGETTDALSPMLVSTFRPSVQPYLSSVMAYDPATLVADLEAPVLVVNGTTDVQVEVADGERLAAADNAELVVIEGMNHILKAVTGSLTEQLPSYGDPTLTLHPDLVPAISAFLSGIE